MNASPLGFLRIKVIALSVVDPDRTNSFYPDTLALPPAFEGAEQVGWLLGETILMLKPDWYAPPTDALASTNEHTRRADRIHIARRGSISG